MSTTRVVVTGVQPSRPTGDDRPRSHVTPSLDVYALRMLSERLQILVTPEQRRKLEAEAARRGESVGSLVRRAVDAAYDPVDRDGRRRAMDGLRAIGERNRGVVLSPDELEALIEDARADELPDGST